LTQIGEPTEHPEIVIVPREDPVPAREPVERPEVSPEVSPELVPA
jgi:hypothetical protein